MHLILSPHPDDAALCLGGILLEKAIENVFVLNVFSKSCYTIYGDGPAHDVTTVRFTEEQDVMNSLHIRFHMLGMPDASLRPEFNGEKSYMDPQNCATSDPVYADCHKRITHFIEETGDVLSIWAPLSIAPHIDHRIVSAYGIDKIGQDEYTVVFYEDTGYDSSLNEQKVAERLHTIPATLEPYIFSFSSLDDKLRLVSRYKTQVNDDLLNKVKRQFYQRRGERVWGEKNVIRNLFS